MSQQLPATGTGTRIDSGKRAGKPHRSCGNAQSRHLASRHVENRVSPCQVRETWREADESHRPIGTAMPTHHLINGNVQQIGDIGQILAIVNHRNLNYPGRSFHVIGDVQRTYGGHHPVTRDEQRIERDVNGPRRRNELFHTGEDGIRVRCRPYDRPGGPPSSAFSRPFSSMFHSMFHGIPQRCEHPQGLVQIGKLHQYAIRAASQESHAVAPP